MTPVITGRETLQQMLGGPTVTNLLYTAVEIGLPDILARQPATPAQVVAQTGGHPDAIQRILRGLAAFGILGVGGQGQYELTAMGSLLRKDVPGSLHRSVRLMGHPAVQHAWTGLPHTAMTGVTAFDHVHGLDFMKYLMANPDVADRFNEFMSSITEGVSSLVARAVDLSHAKTIVDVGGGAGALLRAVLQANPQAAGTIVDVAALRPQAERAIAADGLTGRCTFLEGDFFAEVPQGADVYLVKSVLHDWDDDRAAAILATCRTAMAEDSRLLIVERGMPEAGQARPDFVMSDLIMLAMAPGRERTVTEYTDLADRAGLAVRAVINTADGPDIFELVKQNLLPGTRRSMDFPKV